MSDGITDTQIEQRLLEMVEAINRGEIEPMSRSVGAGLVIRDGHSGLPSGREGLKLRLRLWETALPDLTLAIAGLTVTGDEAVLTLAWSGTHLGELFGVTGTGEKVSFRATIQTLWAKGVMTELHCNVHGAGELQGE